MRPIYRSYIKTLLTSVFLSSLSLAVALLGLAGLTSTTGTFVVIIAFLVMSCAVSCAVATAIVLVRYRRDTRGAKDLFLLLNQSRDEVAIRKSPVLRRSQTRRWLARQFLGHDLITGDLVQVKTWEEIRATLDTHGCFEKLPFMPEMLAMCGKQAIVFRCMHRLFDYRKTRRMRHMEGAVLLAGAICEGSSHGDCEAACHTIWKVAWLQRPGSGTKAVTKRISPRDMELARANDLLKFGTSSPHYVCQLTQLNAASFPVSDWSIVNFFRPLIAGNVTLAAFTIGWLTNLFNQVQHLRQGVGYPVFERADCLPSTGKDAKLEAGQPVSVRSSTEISATLNERYEHRGMGFEFDMLKYCGQRLHVRSEVRKLIDIVTGEMRAMKTPAYILRDVHFSGERQQFNSQYEPLFWRGAWLKSDDH